MKDVKFWRYYIPSIDGVEGWGVFVLDSTGMFAAVTDYGNYSYMWPIKHTGCEDFRDFFDHKDAYYILGKCAPSGGREYQGDRTEEALRQRILRLRFEHSITEDQARSEWDLLDTIDFYHKEGFHEWYEQTDMVDAHEYAVYDYTCSERAFADKLFPKFCDAVASELKAERENQYKEADWIKYQCEECGRKFAVPEDLEEPGCPECHETNCAEIG